MVRNQLFTYFCLFRVKDDFATVLCMTNLRNFECYSPCCVSEREFQKIGDRKLLFHLRSSEMWRGESIRVEKDVLRCDMIFCDF